MEVFAAESVQFYADFFRVVLWCDAAPELSRYRQLCTFSTAMSVVERMIFKNAVRGDQSARPVRSQLGRLFGWHGLPLQSGVVPLWENGMQEYFAIIAMARMAEIHGIEFRIWFL